MLGDNIPQVQLADVAGALSYRQGQIDKDAERRKEIVTNQLAGQALSAGLQEGTPLYELAKANPSAYVALSKTIGIDPADGSGMHQMATVSAHLAQIMNVDGSGQLAAQYMQSEADRRSKLGLNTDYLTKGLQHLQENSGTFKNAITMAANAFNPPEKKDIVKLAKNDIGYDPTTGKIVVSNIQSGSDVADESTAHAKDLKKYQELKSSDPEMAQQFGQMVGLVSREGKELTSGVTKILDDLTEENKIANYNVARYTTLAKNIRSSAYDAGLKGKAEETVKSLFGNEDETTALKKELALIRNSEALKSLPAGSASEKDVAMVMEPMPTANSNPKYVADWLDSYAKVSAGAAKYTEAKADFIAKNGSIRDKEGNTFIKVWKDQKQSGIAKLSAAERLKQMEGR